MRALRELRSAVLRLSFRIAGDRPRPMGRWRTTDSEAVRLRRATLADIDSCGEERCSDPRSLVGVVYARSGHKKGGTQRTSVDFSK